MEFPILRDDQVAPPTRESAHARMPKPPWLKVPMPTGERYQAITNRLADLGLATVCKEAHCPNIGECWSGGTATIMLMGDVCTRGCRFCAVQTGHPAPLDPEEPHKAALAVSEMGVDYIVLTSVNRDDLPDGGASHFAATVRELKRLDSSLMVEVLIPDFYGDLGGVDSLVEAGPEVIAHNVETTPRLTRRVRDARATFDRSVRILETVKDRGRGRAPGGVDILAKTSLMLGLGETEDEIVEVLHALRAVDTDVVTFGQYLQPTPKHLEVAEYVHPDVFDHYADIARGLDFVYVASGPLVRSSYRAGEFYLHAHIDRLRQGVQA
jgi:lipoic acid synthetase